MPRNRTRNKQKCTSPTSQVEKGEGNEVSASLFAGRRRGRNRVDFHGIGDSRQVYFGYEDVRGRGQLGKRFEHFFSSSLFINRRLFW